MPTVRTTLPWWLRVSLRVAATSVGAGILSRVLPHVDRLLREVSADRLSLYTLFWRLGIPVVKLTTTGAKTGKERTVPVLGLRGSGKWIVVASNWGREQHPAWYHNLQANPIVTVTYKDQTGQYIAREATGGERDAYWDQVTQVNPSLETYQRRAGDRHIPVIVLTPRENASADLTDDRQSVQSEAAAN